MCPKDYNRTQEPNFQRGNDSDLKGRGRINHNNGTRVAQQFLESVPISA
jgi:hypothetical protein